MPEHGSDDVVAVVRQKIAARTLPAEMPDRTWAGRGTGQTCDACDRQITTTEIEHEADCRGDARSASIKRASRCGLRRLRRLGHHGIPETEREASRAPHDRTSQRERSLRSGGVHTGTVGRVTDQVKRK
jgi:hypothetical protein